MSFFRSFINVIYRKILYRIPLKFLLILLAVFSLCVATVKGDDISSLITNLSTNTTATVNAHAIYQVYNIDGDYGTYCMKVLEATTSQNALIRFWFNNTLTYNSTYNYGLFTDWTTPYYICLYANRDIIYLYNDSSYTLSIEYDFFKLNTLLNTQVPVYTSLDCQTQYNLIPISSVNENYCTTNNLCPASDCPINTGSISTLYINDILHVGAPFIYLDIPEEIGWEYGYTQGGTNMLIDVEGYNVDYESVQNVIDQQNYKPTQEDFQKIIALLGPYGEIIIFFVFLFIVWAWIKKPFKSKL